MAVRYESEVVISSELQDLVDRFADSYLSSGELAQKILDKAKEEGIPNEKVRELIESALEKRGLSDRQRIRAIPAELKRSYTRKSDTMSHSGDNDRQESVKDFIKLPDSLYDDLMAAIETARSTEQREITIYHDGHRIVEVHQVEGN